MSVHLLAVVMPSSSDVRRVAGDPELAALLGHAEVLAVDQDPLGSPATLIEEADRP